MNRPYRVLFTGCRSQRTADKILMYLRAGADVTVQTQRGYGGVDFQKMDVGSIQESIEFTAEDFERLKMHPAQRRFFDSAWPEQAYSGGSGSVGVERRPWPWITAWPRRKP